MLADRKILFTGATGQAVGPCAEALARENEKSCLGRFSDPRSRAELVEAGIRTFHGQWGRARSTSCRGTSRTCCTLRRIAISSTTIVPRRPMRSGRE